MRIGLWSAVAVLTLHAVAVRADDFAVVINELHYHPAVDGSGEEFLELFNPSDAAVDLAGWTLSDGVQFTFPAETTLEPGGFLVVANDRVTLMAVYGIVNVVGDLGGRLSNGGETILLKNADGVIVDRVQYQDADPWPRAPDGFGPSLERISAAANPDLPDMWAASLITGGTPGGPNTARILESTHVLIAVGDEWRFFRGLDEPALPLGAWADPTFDDDAWERGPTGIGFSDGDDATELTDMRGRYTNVYLRKTFVVDDPGGVLTLTLIVDYDDGFIVYLNGTEVARRNYGAPGVPMPVGAIADSHHEASAGNNGNPSETIDLSDFLAVLEPGDNVLAIQVANAAIDSADLSLIPALQVSRRTEGALIPPPRDVVINEVFPGAGVEGWIELFNLTDTEIDLAGRRLVSIGAGPAVFTFGTPTPMPARGFVTVNEASLPFPLTTSRQWISLETDDGRFIDGIRTGVGPGGTSFGRFPNGGDEMFTLGTPTRDAPNDAQLETDVVINEIMYNPPLRMVDGLLVEADDEEYIELHNRSGAPISLDGWRLERAVNFDFFGVEIPAGGYVVIAREPAIVEAKHDILDVLGPWTRRLSNRADDIVLRDALGGIVDRVRYADDGYWPRGPDGTGASAELSHPDADNAHGLAWETSIAGGTPGERNAALGVLREGENVLAIGVWNLDAASPDLVLVPRLSMETAGGEQVLVDMASATPMQYLVNVDTDPGIGLAWTRRGFDDSAWLTGAYGVGHDDDGEAAALLVTDVGPGVRSVFTRARFTIADLAAVQAVLLGVDYDDGVVAWINGKEVFRSATMPPAMPRWDTAPEPHEASNGAEPEFGPLVDLTAGLLEPDPRPVVARVRHEPPTPTSAEPVVVRVQVSDVGGVTDVTLHYAPEGDDVFQTAAMLDDGLAGDEAAGDTVYSAMIPPHATDTVVRFFITADDTAGQTTLVPCDPGRGRCAAVADLDEDRRDPAEIPTPTFLYQVDDRPEDRRVPTYRIVMLASEFAHLDTRSDYSNVLLDATFLVGGRVRYNVGVRYRGAGSRNDEPHSYRINFPDDDLFEGIKHLSINALQIHRQLLGSDLLRRAGLPYPIARPVNFWVNNGLGNRGNAWLPAAALYARVETIDSEFLERFFPDDDGGNLYRGNISATLAYLGDDPAPYKQPTSRGMRYEKETNIELDDYTDIITLTDILNNTPDETYADAIRAVVDVQEWVRYFAANFAMSNAEGGIIRDTGDDYFLYRRPSDGRWVFIPWDHDTVFLRDLGRDDRGATELGILSDGSRGGVFRPSPVRLPAIRRFITHPEFAPLYVCELQSIVANEMAPELIAARVDELRGLLRESDLDQIAAFPPIRSAALTAQMSFAFTTAVDVEILELTFIPDSAAELWQFFRGTAEPTPDETEAPTADWAQPDFDDALWEQGPAGFGYGDDDDRTVLDDMRRIPEVQDGYSTVYIRKSFELADPAIDTLELRILYDDGFVAYLNGVEVYRDRAPGAPGTVVPFDETADANHEALQFETIDLSHAIPLLVPGFNVLAVQGLNRAADSSDFSLLPTLLATGAVGSIPRPCGPALRIDSDTILLTGTAPSCPTAFVRVNGIDADYDLPSSIWTLSVSLDPGRNLVEAIAFDADGGEVAREQLQIIRDGIAVGDADADGDIDLADFVALQGCFAGPAVPIGPACAVFDFDCDDDVDLADLVAFQAAFTGVR